MNYYIQFVAAYQAALRKKYPTANLSAGWSMPIAVQKKLLDNTAEVDLEDKRFYNAVSHQFQASLSEAVQFHGLPPEVESYQSGTQQVVTVGAGGTDKLDIRRIEIPLLYEDEMMDDFEIVGNSKAFLAKMDGQIADLIVEATVWVALNGLLQNQYFQKNEPENSNIGIIQLLRDNNPANIFSEQITGSNVIIEGEVRKVPCDSAAVVDKTGGKVGIAVKQHGFPVGGRVFTTGTTNYKNSYLVDADTTVDEVVIVATYAAESLNSTDNLLTMIPDFANQDELVESFLASSVVDDMKKRKWAAIGSRRLFGLQKQAITAEQGMTPSEKEKLAASQKQVAGLEKFSLSSMPAGTIILADPKNIKFGHHKKKTERTVKYEDDKRGLVVRHKYYRGFALITAIFQVNNRLKVWAQSQLDLGYLTLVDVPQASIAGKKELEMYYEAAVFSWAMGELHPELVSLFARKEALDYMDGMKANRTDYYDQAVEKIGLIEGNIVNPPSKKTNISCNLL